MIKEFEFYHGVVFTKLIHSSKKCISIKSFPTSSNASYIYNENIGIYIKHSTKRLSPWHFSLQKIHLDEIDCIVEKDEPIIELKPSVIGDTERAIGENVSKLIEDGSTLQLGIGGLSDALLLFLKNKKDLGIHT